VSTRDTHRAQKKRGIKLLLGGPNVCMPYPRPTSGRSTTVPLVVIPHSISLFCLSHPSLPFHSLTPVLHSLSHLLPLPFSSPATCATSAPACVTPTASSQPLCLLHLAITHRVSLPLCQSSRQTLIHAHCLAIPAGIQLISKWQNAEATTSHRCSADSSLFYPYEAVIKVGWWWLNIFSTINGNPEKGLSASWLSCSQLI
jgi:hypothetical protein